MGFGTEQSKSSPVLFLLHLMLTTVTSVEMFSIYTVNTEHTARLWSIIKIYSDETRTNKHIPSHQHLDKTTCTQVGLSPSANHFG